MEARIIEIPCPDGDVVYELEIRSNADTKWKSEKTGALSFKDRDSMERFASSKGYKILNS